MATSANTIYGRTSTQATQGGAFRGRDAYTIRPVDRPPTAREMENRIYERWGGGAKGDANLIEYGKQRVYDNAVAQWAKKPTTDGGVNIGDPMGTGAGEIMQAAEQGRQVGQEAVLRNTPEEKAKQGATVRSVSTKVEKQQDAPVPPPKPKVTLADPITRVKPDVVTALAYPKDIDTVKYKLNIMLAKYNDQIALDNRNDIGDMKDCIITLPIPSNLLTSTGLDYGNVNLGAIGGELLNATTEIARSNDFFGTLRQKVENGINNAASSDLQQVLLRRLVSGIDQSLGSAVDLVGGSTPNPHIAVTFNNVKLRTFTYTWKFSPDSKDESAELQKIVKELNKRILPARSKNKFLLEYPNQCLLKITPVEVDDLLRYKPCVVTDMSVNYAPSGIPAFFAGTNLPVEIELALSFQEIQIRTSEDYK